jgi:exodeoxyribonuclease V alpha subunit
MSAYRSFNQRKQAVRPNPQPTPTVPVDEPTTLLGFIEHIVFRSDETGYTVCSVRPDGSREAVPLVGNFAALWEGERIRAEGVWTRHKTHGFQFKADKIECQVPTSLEGIERYLASGLIKGVGKVYAHRLVKHFGDKTLQVIEHESARLREVPGIGPSRREEIKESWKAQRAVREIMIFLHGHGVGSAHALRIYKQYGPDAIAVVKRNPYQLGREVWGIGFKSADRIAANIGIPRDSELRAQAGVVHLIESQSEEGHCHCPRSDLIAEAAELLEIPAAKIEEALDVGIRQRDLVEENGHIYPARLFRAETGIVTHLVRLSRAPLAGTPIDVDRAIAWAQDRMKIQFDPRQSAALANTLRNKVSIITGGPGVGKTTIIRALVDIFTRRRLRVILAAPTGRAAKRMEEATGFKAATVHRLLKYQPHSGSFLHGPDDPIPGDVFIFDEASMIDTPLMNSLLAALPGPAQFLLVGDIDQLPSVGPGNVLNDLIASGVIPAIRLETIFRQGNRSWIVVNAHHINNGEFIEIPPRDPDHPADFFFVECDTPENVIERMLTLITQRIPAKFGLDPRTDIQVLSPMRRNQLGAANLNTVLQDALNPDGPAIERFGRRFRTGDRVLQIRNNYDKDVFNGDIGRIKGIDTEQQVMVIDFDKRLVNYDFSELDELDLAYACSIHKSQGSEYPAVLIVLTTQHYKLLQRNLIYTGITRGRKLVGIIGSSKALRIAIHNNTVQARRTGLRARLIAAFNRPA